jgi:hypothetical protein
LWLIQSYDFLSSHHNVTFYQDFKVMIRRIRREYIPCGKGVQYIQNFKVFLSALEWINRQERPGQQQIATSEEVEELTIKGWRFVLVLPNSKVLVQK